MKPNKHTQARILQALHELVAEEGIDKLSMRLLAHRTGIKQAKLKQYYGNMNRLLLYFRDKDDLFQPPSERLPTAPTGYHWPDNWRLRTTALFRTYRSEKTARELLRVELLNNTSMGKQIHKKRELDWSRLSPEFDIEATLDKEALELMLLGGMNFLTIMAHVNRPVIGIDLRSEEGWQRVEQAMRLLYKALGQEQGRLVKQVDYWGS